VFGGTGRAGSFFGDRHVRASGRALGEPNARPWQTQQKREGTKRLTQQERVGGTEKNEEESARTRRRVFRTTTREAKIRSTIVASVCFGPVRLETPARSVRASLHEPLNWDHTFPLSSAFYTRTCCNLGFPSSALRLVFDFILSS
jgi:hypothetical protein